jgi:NAD(P)-dependent dehydrogenase (short-subunit alcohol dehydrogenase family)
MNEAFTLITGASSGIGRCIAQELSASRRLVLSGRNEEKLEAARAECADSERHLVWVEDLGETAGVGDSLTTFMSSEGVCVDHFIHSAGTFAIQAIRSVDMSRVLRMFNVNLFSAVEILRVLVRRRVNSRTLRSITFISSIASRLGVKGYSAYAASKGGLNALARSLAVELAPDIRVNAVLPGGIETEGTRGLFADPALSEEMAAKYPLGLGQVQDIANAVEFITSEKARWITGQEIVVDGGRSIV